MDLSYSFGLKKSTNSSTKTNEAVTTTESFVPVENKFKYEDSVFSPLAAPFQSKMSNEAFNLIAQQEPRAADTVPPIAEKDDVFVNFSMNNADNFDSGDGNIPNYLMRENRSPLEPGTSSLVWNDASPSIMTADKNADYVDTFDFLIKSLSSANNYVSMLSNEQLSVLRAIRPSLLYEFLQEIAKVRSNKRLRRAQPNECAFCKNNGVSEECYSSHALKDWRGRVLCPVLRAFQCPRCGATGERAHTIKYCPASNANDSGSYFSNMSNRGVSSSSSLLLGSSTKGPGSQPYPHTNQTSSNNNQSFWSRFQMN